MKVKSLLVSLMLIVVINSCYASASMIGTIIGGAAGGLVGSRFGGGSGKLWSAGGGAVAGAVLGNVVGSNMDKTNQLSKNNESTNQQYSQRMAPVFQSTSDESEHSYKECREEHSMAMIAGKQQQIYSTACRQSDGTWKLVS